ncbi:MAG TPA: mechanosensitive ion channel family protein, partial [Holophagaceae bacterium]|nr:mechanosensitive ion channel family protein [Holophagaceae bacterium]
ILGALQRHTLAHRAKALAVAGAETLAVTLGALLLLWLLGRAFRRLYARIEASEGLFGGFRIQNLELLSTERVRQLAKRGAQLLRLAFTLILAYAYLSIVFSFFPWTKGLASKLLALVWAPVSQLGGALVGYLPKLLFLAVIVLATRWLLKLVHLVFTGIGNGALRIEGFHPDWAQPTYKLARLLVLGFALVVAFPYLPGSGSEAFKGVSLFVGLLFSLGSSGAVANMIAGVMITYMRPFRLGDVIQVGETRGTVVEKSLLVTRIRTPKNVDVTLPNSTILGSQILNYTAQSRERALLLHTTVTIGYDVPWRQVHGLLLEAARAAEGILQDPVPFVNQTGLDDFYVSYQLNAATDDPERMNQTYSRLHEAIQDAFFKAGVEIMSPHFAALRDGNTAAIPEADRPAGYEPPGFRIQRP